MKNKISIIVIGMLLASCTNDPLEEINKEEIDNKLLKNLKTASRQVPETINRTDLSVFNEWENIPVNIISETSSDNKYLTWGNKNQNLFFSPFRNNNNNDQKFYIKRFSTYVELSGYPNFENQKYGIVTSGLGNDYSTYVMQPNPVQVGKLRLWDVENGEKANYMLEALYPSGLANPNNYPGQGVLTANKSNIFDTKVYFGTYDKNNFQRFKILPAEEFEFLDISYDTGNSATISKPDFTATASLSNGSSIQQSLTMTFAQKATNSSSWNIGSSISATIGIESELMVPLLVSGKFTFSSTVSASGEYGQTKTEEDSRTYAFPVLAPPKSLVKGKVTVKQYTADINYTARVRGKITGRIINITGVWNGVSSDEITYKIEEIKLEDGTVQKY